MYSTMRPDDAKSFARSSAASCAAKDLGKRIAVLQHELRSERFLALEVVVA